ncbi:hypothetical protein [Bryobacter aggregatus]|uniref:hypothetical protein n=1 Tax=Bryobacter aggregatus TaxID=360054 RepID=UPI00138E0129|nr:hypothetical protein [Bryobacter aggregatus]
MQTIQVVLELELLQEADQAAKKHHMHRSALIRDALRLHRLPRRSGLWGLKFFWMNSMA